MFQFILTWYTFDDTWRQFQATVFAILTFPYAEAELIAVDARSACGVIVTNTY